MKRLLLATMAITIGAFFLGVWYGDSRTRLEMEIAYTYASVNHCAKGDLRVMEGAH